MSPNDDTGDDLRRVRDLLRRAKELMDSPATGSMLPPVDSLGQKDLESAARHFEKSWSAGRDVVGRDLESTVEALCARPERE